MLFFPQWDCKKFTHEAAQTAAIFRSHGDEFDAHALAGARVPHQSSSVDIAPRDSEQQLDALSGSGRLRGFDKYAA